ncbi:hypothetical protein C2845_PM07G11370 [Panicum miliaceum]|uniref:Uncharacterized protein n=1 Tax=Panicum miliaceum TaxID=4540 RepID=A0A3L6SIK6_PANMI|nr:hypothetical protein C2845_PM07G11370 [Panicum miliaceum]
MVSEVQAAAAAAAAPLAPELAWSPSTMTDADIEVLVAQGLLPENAISGWRSCFGEAFPLEDRTETQQEMGGGVFVVTNRAPSLPPRTGLPPFLNARWEEKPTEEEMVEVEVQLAELQKLKAEKLTGAMVALSFAKRLTQPIQERVHPGRVLGP